MRSALAITLAIACARVALAQSGVVAGTVRAFADSSPVMLATVDVDDLVQRSDSTGAFRFVGLAPGLHPLHIRRLGYAPFSTTIEVNPKDSTVVVVAMKALPQLLHEITISGRVVSVPYRFESVYRRAAEGFGHFITREEIIERNPRRTRDLLQAIPGVLVFSDKLVFQRCRKQMRAGPELSPANKVQVYIDGQRFTQFVDDVEAALGSVAPQNIQAIEVYSGISQMPPDFGVDACAAIAIWTTRY
jgi:hypothetical protein